MIRYMLRRLLYSLPTLIGITFATFVLLNIAMKASGPAAGGASPGVLAAGEDEMSDFSRMHGLHLPLFLNVSIDDIRQQTKVSILQLLNSRESTTAQKRLERLGGAVFPHLIPQLEHAAPELQDKLLTVLDTVSVRMGINVTATTPEEKAEFWSHYWSTFGPDFDSTRAARLVQRVLRRKDELAESELRRLDTFALPEIMEALEDTKDVAAQSRLVDLACGILGVNDRLPFAEGSAVRNATLARWEEWWTRHYDEFTVFDGSRAISGAVTETRYFRWLARLATLDFGVSLRDSRPIAQKLKERLPITLVLSILALLMAYLVAIPFGILSALKNGSFFDKATTFLSFILFSLPTFWVAMLMVRYFSKEEGGQSTSRFVPLEGWIEGTVYDVGYGLFLPVLCLSYVSMAMLIRYQRIGMLQVIGKHYILTARAKGLTKLGAILKHGLRNGLLPVVTMLGLQLPYLVSGSVIVERIFGIPGMGYETFEAIRANDHPWLMAVVTVTAALTMVGVVAADALYAALDPRITPGRRREGIQ